MKKYKTLSFILCASFVLSLGTPAFASDLDNATPSSEEETNETYEESIPESSTETVLETIPESNTETPLETNISKETETTLNPETEPSLEPVTESHTLESAKGNRFEPLDETKYENKQVFRFVKRMYNLVLGRDPEKEGFDNWYNSLINGSNKGSDLVDGFFFSNEFTKKALSDEEYIRCLYKALFDREADASGLASWLDVLSSGVSRRYICAGFVGSTEYHSMCHSFGILPGTMGTRETRDHDQQITEFVNHFYVYCLGRSGEPDGLNHWTGGLISKALNGVDIAKGFFFSDEFTKKNVSDDVYVETLYQTFLSRSSDPSGKAAWVKLLKNGSSRLHVLSGFVNSSEFNDLCNKYGIVRGSIASTETRDQNDKLTAYITHLYNTALDRSATADELNHWTDIVINKGILAEQLLATFFQADEYVNKHTDDITYIKDLHEALLRRPATADDISSWAEKLNASSRDQILKDIVKSTECQKICTEVGIAVTNGWCEIDGNYYYYENDKQQTGWVTYNGHRYYLNPNNNGARVVGWNYIDGYKFYFDNNGQLVEDVEYLIGKQDSYYIKVYKWANYLIVFAKDGNNGYTIPVKAMITSCGNNTPTGDYRTPYKYRWLTMVGGSQAQWCTQIIGDYLFHSVPYRTATNNTLYTDIMYNYLGTTQSLGCIRLQAGDAKWIYDNCALGTLVNIDPNTNSGPFDKPEFNPIPAWHTWDPTDPTAQHLCKQHGCH